MVDVRLKRADARIALDSKSSRRYGQPVVKLIALVLPLGLDTFAVAAALGLVGLDRKRRLRVSLLMASFEATMPLVGLALGAPIGRTIGAAADYVAIGILLGFGLFTLIASRDDDDEKIGELATATGWGAVLLGLSISLDELAIGFTLGLLRLPALLVIILIGAQAFIVSQLGLRLGARVGREARESAQRLAGLALTGLGAWLVIEKIASG